MTILAVATPSYVSWTAANTSSASIGIVKINSAIAMEFLHTRVAIGGRGKLPPRGISGSEPPRDIIPTAAPMFSGVSVSMVHKPHFQNVHRFTGNWEIHSRTWNSDGTQAGSMIVPKFQRLVGYYILGVTQHAGTKINVVTVMLLWRTGEGAPTHGKCCNSGWKHDRCIIDLVVSMSWSGFPTFFMLA